MREIHFYVTDSFSVRTTDGKSTALEENKRQSEEVKTQLHVQNAS